MFIIKGRRGSCAFRIWAGFSLCNGWEKLHLLKLLGASIIITGALISLPLDYPNSQHKLPFHSCSLDEVKKNGEMGHLRPTAVVLESSWNTQQPLLLLTAAAKEALALKQACSVCRNEAKRSLTWLQLEFPIAASIIFPSPTLQRLHSGLTCSMASFSLEAKFLEAGEKKLEAIANHPCAGW